MIKKKMNNFNYLVALEGFLHCNSRKCSVAVLTALAKSYGCNEEMVDKVVNAVIAEYILSIIAPSDGNTKVGVANGGGHVTLLNPTCETLINTLVGERFTDLSEDRARKLIESLIHNSALKIDENSALFKIKDLTLCQLVSLD